MGLGWELFSEQECRALGLPSPGKAEPAFSPDAPLTCIPDLGCTLGSVEASEDTENSLMPGAHARVSDWSAMGLVLFTSCLLWMFTEV